MAGRLEFDFHFREPRQERRSPSDPFRVLVIGDFSQHPGGATGRAPASVRPRPVDADSFDRLLRSMEPVCQVAGLADPLVFRRLEDFHPDGLLEALPAVAELRASRQRLTDPETRRAEAERLTGGMLEGSGTPAPADEAGTRPEQDSDTIGRLLGRAPAGGRSPPPAGPLDSLLRELVTPYLQPEQDPDRPDLVAAVDAALSGHLRAVLHDPAFQALEGRWRGLRGLVEATEGSSDVSIEVLDVPKAALALELETQAGNLAGSALYRLLLDDRGPGTAPWSLLVCDLSFEPEGADLQLLARLGALAGQCNAPLLAGAGAGLLEGTAAGGDWTALRRSAVAPWLGLAGPRVLGRRPYGPRSEAVESLDFVELEGVPGTAEFLWINPAFTLAGLLLEAFLEGGWQSHPQGMVEIADLPLALYESPEGRALRPCAESLLSHDQAGALLERGVMPLQAWRDRNALRLLRWQSVADPPTALAGPWGG